MIITQRCVCVTFHNDSKVKQGNCFFFSLHLYWYSISYYNIIFCSILNNALCSHLCHITFVAHMDSNEKILFFLFSLYLYFLQFRYDRTVAINTFLLYSLYLYFKLYSFLCLNNEICCAIPVLYCAAYFSWLMFSFLFLHQFFVK